MVKLHLSEKQFAELYEALDARASQITEDNAELRALFEVRQELGPHPEGNKGDEILDVTFNNVERDEALEALSSPHEGLSSEHSQTLDWLAENLKE